MELSSFVADFGMAIKAVDARHPQAVSIRTGATYQPGIGPHPEAQAVELIAGQMEVLDPARYAGQVHIGVPYPEASRQKCDLCIGAPPYWQWAIEVKLLRLMGDNGKPNDNMLMHILSPYSKDRSALTDCEKLLKSGLRGQKAVLIYGFDYPSLPMDPAIDAFETLARQRVMLGPRCLARYEDLVHPVHHAGRVFGWQITEKGAG